MSFTELKEEPNATQAFLIASGDGGGTVVCEGGEWEGETVD